MIYEMRTYRIRVGEMAKYLEQFEQKGLPVVTRYCTLVGYWVTEVGALNEVVHIWSFPDLAARQDARARWWADPDWLEGYLPLALPLVVSQKNKLLAAAPFSPL